MMNLIYVEIHGIILICISFGKTLAMILLNAHSIISVFLFTELDLDTSHDFYMICGI